MKTSLTLDEHTEADGTVTRLVRLDYTRCPLSTSGDGALAGDRATVKVTEYEVTVGIRPAAERPMFLARSRRIKSLRIARTAFENGLQ